MTAIQPHLKHVEKIEKAWQKCQWAFDTVYIRDGKSEDEMQQEARPAQFKINNTHSESDSDWKKMGLKKVHMNNVSARTNALCLVYSIVKHNGWHFHISLSLLSSKIRGGKNVVGTNKSKSVWASLGKWVCRALHIFFTSTNIFDIYAIGWQIVCVGVCFIPIYHHFHSVHTAHIPALMLRYVLSVCVVFLSLLLLWPHWSWAMCFQWMSCDKQIVIFCYRASRIDTHSLTHGEREVCKIDGWLESWARYGYFGFLVSFCTVWQWLVQYLNNAVAVADAVLVVFSFF